MKTIAAVLAFILFAQAAVLACSCGPKPSVEDAFTESKVVFAGRCVSGRVAVKRLKGSGSFAYRQFTFEVTHSWKGANGKKRLVISTGTGDGDCGVPYEIGASYLVYGFAEQGGLSTNICMRGWVDGSPDAKAEKKLLDGIARTAKP